jgi:hypothetical protein
MKFFNKNKPQDKFNPNSFTSIQRIMKVEGKIIPALICNGGTYFFTNLEVYSDGIIDAWGAVDLDFFKRKLNSGWVSTSVPDGKEISIHHLCNFTVKKGNWEFSENEFYNYVMKIIKDMNPKLQNLYNFHDSDTIKVGKVNYAKLPITEGKSIKFEESNFQFSRPKLGDNFLAFRKSKQDEYYLCNISVFQDSSVIIGNIPTQEELSMEELKELVNNAEVITDVKRGQRITIYGLGNFEIKRVTYSVGIEEIMSELDDMIAKLNSEKTTSEICAEIYQDYLESPSTKLKEELRLAYEKVPKHLRIYILGDMDMKDIPIRMVIYGKGEIRNWSHYIMSKLKGYELPEINVPEPKDEN